MAKSCPKCGFGMLEGVLGYDHVVGIHWMTELPKEVRSDDKKLRHSSLNPKSAATVHSWICNKCGFIELFASGV